MVRALAGRDRGLGLPCGLPLNCSGHPGPRFGLRLGVRCSGLSPSLHLGIPDPSSYFRVPMGSGRTGFPMRGPGPRGKSNLPGFWEGREVADPAPCWASGGSAVGLQRPSGPTPTHLALTHVLSHSRDIKAPPGRRMSVLGAQASSETSCHLPDAYSGGPTVEGISLGGRGREKLHLVKRMYLLAPSPQVSTHKVRHGGGVTL